MGITRTSKGVLDLSQYRPLHKSNVISGLNFGVYGTAVSITGRGYINKALIDSGVANTQMRLTVDGVVVYLGKSASASTTDVYGVVLESLITNNQILFLGFGAGPSGARNVYFSALPAAEYPYTSGGSTSVLLNAPIFFKNSLLVEIQNTATSNASMYYNITGGTL